jgi:hypothetical protein
MSTLVVHACSIAAYIAQDVLILLTGRLRVKLVFLRLLVELSLIKERAQALVLSPLLAEHVHEGSPLIKSGLVVMKDLIILVLRDGLSQWDPHLGFIFGGSLEGMLEKVQDTLLMRHELVYRHAF